MVAKGEKAGKQQNLFKRFDDMMHAHLGLSIGCSCLSPHATYWYSATGKKDADWLVLRWLAEAA
jgi:hypothetical protein